MCISWAAESLAVALERTILIVIFIVKRSRQESGTEKCKSGVRVFLLNGFHLRKKLEFEILIAKLNATSSDAQLKPTAPRMTASNLFHGSSHLPTLRC